jgi:hypothetical protein
MPIAEWFFLMAVLLLIYNAGRIAQARTQGGGAGENAAFFAGQERRMLYNAIEILLRATGQLDQSSLYSFITGAALALEELKSDEWQAGFHNKMLQLAKTKASTDIEKHDVQLAEQYWTSEIPRMNDKTRTSIEAGLLGGLHGMNTGIARDLLATTTDISPDTRCTIIYRLLKGK